MKFSNLEKITMSESSRLALGPKPGVTYPVEVIYCGNCSMPIEVSFEILYNDTFQLIHSHLIVLRILSRV